MRLRLDLAYDGSGFHGWARQPRLRTVQGEVEAALCKVLHIRHDDGFASCTADTTAMSCAKSQCKSDIDASKSVRLTVAGRTDTGVHASHQVCHIDLEDEVLQRCVGHMQVSGPQALERRLWHILPADIALRSVIQAPAGFDARFSALDRTYVYRISDGYRPVDPRMRGFVLPLEGTVDIDAMNEVAQMTVGLHDFGSFATPNPGGTTIREVKYAHWERIGMQPLCAERYASQSKSSGFMVPALESDLVVFTIVADAFAHNMVRSLVNACVRVGLHKATTAWFSAKVAHPVREGSTGPIAACGLTLEHVAYPQDDQLAARAEKIRARRTLQ